jgi:molybdenum cofactor cytidylyltransferase
MTSQAMTLPHTPLPYYAILLAAGSGSRFDPLGHQNKLLQPLDDGCSVAVTSAANLLAIMPHVLAVVRPGAKELQAELKAIGCEVTTCEQAGDGMGASLAHAIAKVSAAPGWIIALADMPYVKPSTIRTLLDALHGGADIVAPCHDDRRGNPVGFSHFYLPQLLALSGDEGARRLLQTLPVRLVKVNDPGIHSDIDRPQDLLH